MTCPVKWTLASGALFAALIFFLAPADVASAADAAKVTAVVGGVTYQVKSSAAWKPAKSGTQLSSGARIRTDRRGKCEIKFPGGSLVRMPPRADLVLTSVTQNRVKLLSGQVLANAVKGSGVRIEGANATASVQGTWVLFSGEDMSVWEGTATLETPFGQQSVGDQQRAGLVGASLPLLGADGTVVGQVSAQLEGSQLTVTFRAVEPWILRSTAVETSAVEPDRFDPLAPGNSHPNLDARTDEFVLTLDNPQPEEPQALYIVAHAVVYQAGQDEAEIAAYAQGEALESGGMYFLYQPTAVGEEYPWEFPTGAARSWWYGMREGVDSVATPGTSIGAEMRQENFTTYDSFRTGLFGKPTRGSLDVGVQSVSAVAPGSSGLAALPLMTLLGAAEDSGQPQGIRRLGKDALGPRGQLDLYGLLVEGGSLAGGRARVSSVFGPVYAEIGGELSTRFDGEWHGSLSEAFAVWRKDELDITLGRQHYLEGPVNNAPLGAQFGYLTFDGARARYQAPGFTLDALWIDGYRRWLVEPGKGSGWLGRASVPVLGGEIALNALKENGADTGLSLDFGLPAIPGVLDVYGEFGDDPWHQHFETWGIYSPWLFDRAGVDLFVEYARRGDYPHSLSAMAYKDMENGWCALAGFRRVQGEDSELSIGVLKRFGSLAQ